MTAIQHLPADLRPAALCLQTSTSQSFAAWFGASKVVDAQGAPKVVYHGSRTKGEAIHAFSLELTGRQTDKGWLGSAFYFGSAETACAYAGCYRHDPDHFPQGGVVYPVFLALQNPLTLRDCERHDGPQAMIAEYFDLDDYPPADVVRAALIAGGFDGVIYESYAGYQEYAALYPAQIKSAIGNCGAFDLANRDIAA